MDDAEFRSGASAPGDRTDGKVERDGVLEMGNRGLIDPRLAANVVVDHGHASLAT